MEFEFGTNWATYSRYVGDIFGSALAAEGIFAFALESGFLGILLFGWHRVSPRVHFFATVMVALGSLFSAVWIVVANSWQQMPAGFHLVGSGLTVRTEVTDFWAMVFNPSSVDRLSHAVIGSFLAGSFLVLSVSAWYLLKGRFVESSKAAFKIALAVATVSGLGQLFTGHHSANGVAVNQPAKLAAFEGHYAAAAPAEMYLFGWVDTKTQHVTGLGIPGGLSFLLHQDFKAPVRGLNSFRPEDRPPVNFVFQTYHLMVAIGMTLIALTLLACWLLWRGRLAVALAAGRVRGGRAAAPNWQSGGLVLGRSGPPALGGVRAAAHLARAVQDRNGGPGLVSADSLHAGVRPAFRPVSVPAEQENPARPHRRSPARGRRGRAPLARFQAQQPRHFPRHAGRFARRAQPRF